MRRSLRGLLLKLSSFLMLFSVLAHPAAHAGVPALNDYQRYGFESEEDMRKYFTVTETTIEVAQLPPSLYSVIVEPPTAPPKVDNPVPTPAPTPATGGVNVPGASPTPVATPPRPVAPTPVPTPIATPPPKVTYPNGPGVPTGNPVIDVLLNPGLVDSWITLGTKIWSIIAAGRPVSNVNTQRVSVLPAAGIDWTKMSNWKGPATRTYRVKKKNGFGMTVASNTYTVVFNYGGQVNGVGQFLMNATIIPTEVSVLYGFQFDADVQVGQPVNTGSMTDPVAALEMQVHYRLRSIVGDNQGTDAFFVRGDGDIQQLNPTASTRIQ